MSRAWSLVLLSLTPTHPYVYSDMSQKEFFIRAAVPEDVVREPGIFNGYLDRVLMLHQDSILKLIIDLVRICAGIHVS